MKTLKDFLLENWNVTHYGFGGTGKHEYRKWNDVDSWKKRVHEIHGKKVTFTKKDYKDKLGDYSKTHAHLGDKEVGSFSHENNSSSMLKNKV